MQEHGYSAKPASDQFRHRQQSGSFSTIRDASIDSSGVVVSLTETPQPGHRQTMTSLCPASIAISSTPPEAIPMLAE